MLSLLLCFLCLGGASVHLGTITEMPQTEWLINHGNVFLTGLEAGKSKVKEPADSVSGKVHRWLSSVSSHGGEPHGVSFIRSLIPCVRSPSQ